jgi:hypothetical protein
VADYGPTEGAAVLSEAAFQELYDRLRRRALWRPQDRRGALNNISPEQLVAAARSVSRGQSVSLAARVEHEVSADNPNPWLHELNIPPGGLAPDGLDFAMDTIALHVHGDADSHIDALCHVSYGGSFYSDVPADRADAAHLSIDLTGQGIAGRGVLLDIPRVRGAAWLEPGDHVTVADLMAAEQPQDLQVGQGDDLTAACQAAARWAFLCVIAPLRLPIGTGSPVNPIAVF